MKLRKNKKYYAALKSAIDKKHKNGEEANVLDIGTGTGLLSMMAAKCGADSIIACEAFKPIAKCAAKIIRENGYEKTIKLIHKSSMKLTVGENGDLPKRANILVAELFDTELIGEGALSTFHHARQVLLEEGSIVIPAKGTVWVQVIESPRVKAWNTINPIHHKDKETVLFQTNSCMETCSGTATVHDLQLSRIPTDSFTPLLPPQAIFHFDWSGKVPLLFSESVSLCVTPIATGTAHAVFMWWDLRMDTDGQNILSCAPVWEHPIVESDIKKGEDLDALARKIPWRDHWMQAIYYLPVQTLLTVGYEVTFVGCHDEYSFWFNIKNDQKLELSDFERPTCSCCIHVAYSRTRIGQLNDNCRNYKYIEVLKKKINSDSTCLCISDGSLLGIMAVKLGAKEVIIFEPNSLSRRSMEMFVKANSLSTQVKIIDSLEDFPTQKKVDLIFGEPYFVTSILPWDNLRFWYLVSKFFPDVAKFPINATIRAIPMEFKDLHKIRAPIGICESFDLSIFDRFVQGATLPTAVTHEKNLSLTEIIKVDKLGQKPNDRSSQKLSEPSVLMSACTLDNTNKPNITFSAKPCNCPCCVHHVHLELPLPPFQEGFKPIQDSSEISDSPIEAQPLWEYFGRSLGSTFDVASFDLTHDVNLQNHTSVSSSTFFEADGLCNGVALWIDWKLDDGIIVSSGPQQDFQPGTSVIWDPNTKQGVHIFGSSKHIKRMDILSWSFDFTPNGGTMKFNFHINKAH